MCLRCDQHTQSDWICLLYVRITLLSTHHSPLVVEVYGWHHPDLVPDRDVRPAAPGARAHEPVTSQALSQGVGLIHQHRLLLRRRVPAAMPALQKYTGANLSAWRALAAKLATRLGCHLHTAEGPGLSPAVKVINEVVPCKDSPDLL